MKAEQPQIDQNALSRQLAVYGHEAQGKLMSMRVFLSGLTGVSHSLIIGWNRSGEKSHPGRPEASEPLRPLACHPS